MEMCSEEGINLQRGMNYHLHGKYSIILMSLRKGAPYADRIEDDGRVLIYEGHDIPRTRYGPNPKTVDQPMNNPSGSLTQNGLFYQSSLRYKENRIHAKQVKVYEKLYSGIWVYNGLFKLIDAWQELSNNRQVFKFKLELVDDTTNIYELPVNEASLDHSRVIPASVKLQVWKRDRGRCRKCGSQNNLHFDHIIPYSMGGSSLVAENIQLLCARHNLEKKDRLD